MKMILFIIMIYKLYSKGKVFLVQPIAYRIREREAKYQENCIGLGVLVYSECKWSKSFLRC